MENFKDNSLFKQILLILLSTVAGIIAKAYYDDYNSEKNNKKLIVAQQPSVNRLVKDIGADIIKIDYSIKEDSSKIQSYFEKTITLTNSSPVALEDIKIKLTPKDTSITILSDPKANLLSNSEIEDYKISIAQLKNNVTETIIPFLNPDERVDINFRAYSKKNIALFDPLISVREKNLKVIFSQFPDENSKDGESNTDKTIRIFYYFILGLLFGAIVVLTWQLQKTIKRRTKLASYNTEYREKMNEIIKTLEEFKISKDRE